MFRMYVYKYMYSNYKIVRNLVQYLFAVDGIALDCPLAYTNVYITAVSEQMVVCFVVPRNN